MKINPDELVTRSEAAELRGVSHQTISYLIKMGRLRTVEIRGRLFLIRKEVENYKPGKAGRPLKRDKKAKALKRVRTKK